MSGCSNTGKVQSTGEAFADRNRGTPNAGRKKSDSRDRLDARKTITSRWAWSSKDCRGGVRGLMLSCLRVGHARYLERSRMPGFTSQLRYRSTENPKAAA